MKTKRTTKWKNPPTLPCHRPGAAPARLFSGQLLKLGAMIQRANPEWITNPGQLPELPAAPVIALPERDSVIELAVTRRNASESTLDEGLRDPNRAVASLHVLSVLFSDK